MAITLDSIYKPMNDFFLDHFKADLQSPVFFRFAKIHSVISDSDFHDSIFPDQYSSALAREKFSDMVNSVPIEDSDGQHIFFTQNNIDETYHDQWLSPSIPFIPQGINEIEKEGIVNSFNSIKADACNIWENIYLVTINGIMMKYRPSLASPESWYDKNKDELWSSCSLHVKETAPIEYFKPKHARTKSIVASALKPDKSQLWKLRIDDEQLEMALTNLMSSFEDDPTALQSDAMRIKDIDPSIRVKIPTTNRLTVAADRILSSAISGNMESVITPGLFGYTTKPVFNPIIGANMDLIGPSVRDRFHKSYWGLGIKNRIFVGQHVKSIAPTKPVNTSSCTIRFKYIIVSIDRPWLKTSFINDKRWFIPNTAKGQLTNKNNLGVNMSILPIGFVAIKDLNIEANWSETDIETSKIATDFGPFDISSEIKDNKLSHEGMQVIGWLLQRMPALPPNDPPQ